jgi:hypothetical protein
MKHPISEDFGGDYPIVQYADDTLLIVPADARVLFNLKGLLRSFSNSQAYMLIFTNLSWYILTWMPKELHIWP